jgi:hypothetical protein
LIRYKNNLQDRLKETRNKVQGTRFKEQGQGTRFKEQGQGTRFKEQGSRNKVQETRFKKQGGRHRRIRYLSLVPCLLSPVSSPLFIVDELLNHPVREHKSTNKNGDDTE